MNRTLLLAPLALAACSHSTTTESPGASAGVGASPTAPAVASPFASAAEVPDAALGDHHVVLECAIDGEPLAPITIAMWGDRAPITVRNFLRLCDEGFYDGKRFHRILREFMVQGGCPNGNGSGNSAYGTIVSELSEAPDRAHRYGVISMASTGLPDSASCQFFICCDESPSVWGLDGNYASFGRVTSGVAALEALAGVPVTPDPRGEPSIPTREATIVGARVVSGAAPDGEAIERPAVAIDLGGEPARVVVQHVLVGLQGGALRNVERTAVDAESRAREVLARAEKGEDFSALVAEFSDDPPVEGASLPGAYKLLNRGIRDSAAERQMFEVERDARAAQAELQRLVQNGEIDIAEAQARMETQIQEVNALFLELAWFSRELITRELGRIGDVGFSMEVGDIELIPFNPTTSPRGWVVAKRVE